MRIIGDVHHKFQEYIKIASGSDCSIQLGDFGIGFDDPFESTAIEWLSKNPTHKFFRGNHDNYQKCLKTPGFLDDGFYLPSKDLMCVGGAYSSDSHRRFSGISKWDDEEIDMQKWYRIIDQYDAIKPKIMITHDFPVSAIKALFNKTPIESRTQKALQSLWEIHQPAFWIGGHYHESAEVNLSGTRFVCLNELEFIDI